MKTFDRAFLAVTILACLIGAVARFLTGHADAGWLSSALAVVWFVVWIQAELIARLRKPPKGYVRIEMPEDMAPDFIRELRRNQTSGPV